MNVRYSSVCYEAVSSGLAAPAARWPRAFSLWVIACALLSTACGSLTQEAKSPPPAPAPETARVYFALDQGYPSGNAYVVEGTKLLGFVENNEHFAVDLPPGEHLFMLLSSGQDESMKGELIAGKTYHVKLYITPGAWSTRVYWSPLKASGEDLETRKEAIEDTDRVELIPAAAAKWEAEEKDDLIRREKSFKSGEDTIDQVIGPEHAL